MTTRQILIIGAGYAGLMAALRLSKQVRKHDVSVTLINAGDTFVERIRLHQRLAGQPLREHRIADFLKGTGVEFVQGIVEAISPDEQCIRVKTATDTHDLPYYRLVIATGSQTSVTTVPGIREYAHTLDEKSVEQLRRILPDITARQGKCVVVGGGLTGIEAATELAETFPSLQVSVITRSVLGADLSLKAQMHLQKRFAALNITVYEQTTVRTVENGYTVLDDGTHISFDACIWTAGFVANGLAKANNFQVNAQQQVLVDATMQAFSHPAIYATGDAAAFLPEAGIPIRMACATAMPLGAHVADNLLRELNGKTPAPFAFSYAVRCISLGRQQGLIQIVDGDDTVKEQILTGRKAALIKEGICKYTIKMLRLEKRLPGFYPWFKGNTFDELSREFSLSAEMTA